VGQPWKSVRGQGVVIVEDGATVGLCAASLDRTPLDFAEVCKPDSATRLASLSGTRIRLPMRMHFKLCSLMARSRVFLEMAESRCLLC